MPFFLRAKVLLQKSIPDNRKYPEIFRFSVAFQSQIMHNTLFFCINIQTVYFRLCSEIIPAYADAGIAGNTLILYGGRHQRRDGLFILHAQFLKTIPFASVPEILFQQFQVLLFCSFAQSLS